MAEFLAGSSDTNNQAPLTGAQTVSICRHLQSEIRLVESDSDDTKRGLEHTTVHLQKLKEQSEATHEDIHTLQVGLSDVNTGMHKIQNELGRLFEAVLQLQASDQNSKNNIVQLEENKKMIDTRLDAVTKDIAHGEANSKSLRQLIEKKLNEDMRVLLKDVANSKLQLEHVRQEISVVMEAEKENHSSVRQAHASIETVINEVKKSNTVTSIIENRLASTAKGVQANWAKCAELGTGLEKLNECYEKTRARIVDAEGVMKGMGEAGKRTQLALDDAVRNVDVNADRLAQAVQVIENQGNVCAELRHQVSDVKLACEDSKRRIQQITHELKEVAETTLLVRSGLKEQSSMLLPNIHLDSSEAVSKSERHGSLLETGAMRRPPGNAGKSTPRMRM